MPRLSCARQSISDTTQADLVDHKSSSFARNSHGIRHSQSGVSSHVPSRPSIAAEVSEECPEECLPENFSIVHRRYMDACLTTLRIPQDAVPRAALAGQPAISQRRRSFIPTRGNNHSRTADATIGKIEFYVKVIIIISIYQFSPDFVVACYNISY